MTIIDGKQIAAEILARLKELPKPEKFLAVVLVGDDPASVSFIKQKEKLAKEFGVDFRLHQLPAASGNDELRREVGRIAAHATCGGVVVQLPLPEGVNAQYVLNAVPREKDVDVLGERALGAFYAGRNSVAPPAVETLQEILKAKSYKLEASRVAVVGLGTLIGKPVATWLMGKAKGVWLLGRTSDTAVLKDADVVVLGVGKPGIVTAAMLKEGALVVDFGYSTVDGKLLGDFDPSSIANGQVSHVVSYTPTPGGTGPVLVAKLFENFYALNGS